MVRNCKFWILLFILAACSRSPDDSSSLEVGEEFTNSDVRIIVIDTFSVSLSTIKFDSIITSETERLLVGRYEDDFFGTVESSSYFEPTAVNYEIPSDAELDSVALILGYDRYFYNDTTKLSEINVHLLQDELQPEEDVFYNTSKVPFDSIPLATKSFFPEPFDEDSLHINLPLNFGQPLFDLIQENDINDTDDLRDFFKGFTLQPGQADNASVIGYSLAIANTYLRFFYTTPTEFEDEESFFDLFIDQLPEEPNFFNNILSNVTSTPLISIGNREDELPSSDAENLSYLQAGTGFAIKVRFPHIKTLYDIPGTGTVLSANLILKPPVQTYNEVTPLRDSLLVSIIDKNNDSFNQISTGAGPVLGSISGQDEEFSEILYEIPVGVFVDLKLDESPETEDALLLTVPEFTASVDRILLEGEGSDDFEARLILTYAIYDD